MMSIIQNPQPQSDHLHPMNERTRSQERGDMMSIIQNPQPQPDHLPPMNERTRSQERGDMMSIIQNPQPHSDHLPAMNERTRSQERLKSEYIIKTHSSEPLFTFLCGNHDTISLTNFLLSSLLNSPMEPCFFPINGSRTLHKE